MGVVAVAVVAVAAVAWLRCVVVRGCGGCGCGGCGDCGGCGGCGDLGLRVPHAPQSHPLMKRVGSILSFICVCFFSEIKSFKKSIIDHIFCYHIRLSSLFCGFRGHKTPFLLRKRFLVATKPDLRFTAKTGNTKNRGESGSLDPDTPCLVDVHSNRSGQDTRSCSRQPLIT